MTFDEEYQKLFWKTFHRYLESNQPLLIPFTDPCDVTPFKKDETLNSYSGFQFLDLGQRPDAPIWLIGWIWPARSQAAAKLCFKENTELFYRLKNDDDIQDAFDKQLEWEKPPKPSVGFYYNNIDFNDIKIDGPLTGFVDLFANLRRGLEELNEVFSKTLAQYCVLTVME